MGAVVLDPFPKIDVVLADNIVKQQSCNEILFLNKVTKSFGNCPIDVPLSNAG